MQFNAEFYALNHAQHFSFPHAYCDQITDDELARQFYDLSYFPAHIAAYYGGEPSKVVTALRAVPHATTFGAAWMRLKFMTEVYDPVANANYFRQFKKMPRLPAAPVAAAAVPERHSELDVAANVLLMHIIRTIESIVRNTVVAPLDHGLARAARSLNDALPRLREAPCGEFVWRDVSPHDLSVYPYVSFIDALWRAFTNAGFLVQ
jgi:hypothetical protein